MTLAHTRTDINQHFITSARFVTLKTEKIALICGKVGLKVALVSTAKAEFKKMIKSCNQ